MTTKSSLYCSWEMRKPYDGIHFEEMLPLTKAHLFCLGALAVLDPASSFQYCVSSGYFLSRQSSILALCPRQPSCCFLSVCFLAGLSS